MKLFISLLPQRTPRGFTLVETLIAVTVLVFAVIGPFALAAQSLRAAHNARSELFATYLALEGIEILHSIRDNNSADDATVARTHWLDNITNGCAPGCVPDIAEHASPNVWTTQVLSTCPNPNSNCAKIYYNSSTGLYRQGFNSAPGAPWSITPYTRFLTITAVNAQRQLLIKSTVTYLGYGHKTQTLSITDNLYNWFPMLQ